MATPSELLADAACFRCLPANRLAALIVYQTSQMEMGPTAPPATPVATAATSVGQTGFTANWNAAAQAETYRLDVSTSNTFGSFVAGYNNLTVAGTSQAVVGLAPASTYYYRVRAVNVLGTSANSNTIQADLVPSAQGLIDANTWADRVVTNGGVRPGTATINAIGFLFDDLTAASIKSKFHTLAVFVPDNLTAARTPIISTLGSNPYTNTNFVGGDLNKYGLKGDGATKHLDTGVAMNAMDLNNMSMIVMVDDTPIVYGGLDCGVFDGGANAYQVLVADSNTAGAQQGCLADTIGRNFTYNVMPAYLCASRTALNLSNLYIANKWNPHYSVGANAGAIVHPGFTSTMTVFARKRNGVNTIDGWSGRRIKAFALSTAMSEAQSLACYNALQACRQRFEDGVTTYGQDWGFRVQKAGGAAPSAGTIAALDTFMDTLTSSGLLAKIDCINTIAPDSLIAATVPIWRKWGTDPWVNTGWVGADLSTAGLVGAPNKAFTNTGIIQGRSLRLGQNTGWTLYFSVASIGGVIGDSATEYQLVVPAPNQLYWDTPFNGGGGRLTIGAGMGAGYYHCMRNSNSNAQVYSANSGLAHGLRGTNATGGIPALSAANTTLMQVMGRAPFPGGGQMSGTLSFWSFGQALTLAESATYFNAVQALRTALGGGYV